MYLEERIEQLEKALHALAGALADNPSAVEQVAFSIMNDHADTADETDIGVLTKAERAQDAEEPKAVEQPTYTLDDVRAKVTEVMKADKTKKGALQALLKAHGADRVSELEETHFAAVVDAIEKGDF